MSFMGNVELPVFDGDRMSEETAMISRAGKSLFGKL
jgi:hypothetical protein